MREWAKGPCVVDQCPKRSASRLGVCGDHWTVLPEELRHAWWAAWQVDGRVSVWLAARREAIEWLTLEADNHD